MDLKITKLRTGGYVPCFLNHGKRCEEALIAVIAEAYVSGISTRKMDVFDVLCFSKAGCSEDIVFKYVGAAQQGVLAQKQGRDGISEHGGIFEVTYDLRYGVY